MLLLMKTKTTSDPVICSRTGVVATWPLSNEEQQHSPRISSWSCLAGFLIGGCKLPLAIWSSSENHPALWIV